MPSAKAQAGDIVMYTFSHVGIVISDNGKTIQTVEGNTNGEGSREGDGVYFKTRNKSLVKRFVRIKSTSSK
jgi:cell wall-associated NlpC family hydrolase